MLTGIVAAATVMLSDCVAVSAAGVLDPLPWPRS